MSLPSHSGLYRIELNKLDDKYTFMYIHTTHIHYTDLCEIDKDVPKHIRGPNPKPLTRNGLIPMLSSPRSHLSGLYNKGSSK